MKYNVIVGIDGAASTVRRLLTGKRQACSLALEDVVPMISQSTIIYYAPELHGYFWYIPRGVDATVGCVYHKLGDNNSAKCQELFSSFRPSSNSMSSIFMLLEKLPILASSISLSLNARLIFSYLSNFLYSS